MNVVNEAVRNIEELFAAAQYPIPFLEKYDQMECLASHRGLETFLVQDKNGKRLFVAKCYDKSVYTDAQETAILQSLHHKGLPAFADEFQNDRTLCIVREYIEGTPLNQYAVENELSQKQIVALCVDLCDILIYLHEQQPPVIHRDIKPQNLIIGKDGKPTLIDFDTARTFKIEADSDTQFFGTKGYAPPEQYGFTQTDCRADVYALGILLRFLCTGSTQESADSAAPASIQKIIAKCTAFSPKERFSSARAVQKALLALDEHKRLRRAQLLTLTITAMFFLCTGFALGRYTRLLTPPAVGVTFEEPLIERAVRAQLDKTEDEPIMEDELKDVRALCLFGDHVSKSSKTLNGFQGGERGKRGSVRSLDDLALMPNLEEVVVSYQELEDISGLSVLKHLVSVDLKHNQISDLSPLANMPILENVCAYETNVSDATILDTCPRLRFLELGASLITTPMKIGGSHSVRHLSLKYVQLDTLEGMERFTRLNTLDVSGATAPDWDAIRYAYNLKTLYTDDTQLSQLSDLFADTGITVTIEE